MAVEGERPVPTASIREATDASEAMAPGDQPPLNRLVAAVSAPALALSSADGQIRAVGVNGLYVHDVRALSQLTLAVDGKEPVPLGMSIGGGSLNRFEAAAFNVGSGRPDPTVYVDRHRVVSSNGMSETFAVSSRDRQHVGLHLELTAACDLAPIAEVKSGRRPLPATPRLTPEGFRWLAHDGSSVELVASPPPDAVDAELGTLVFELSLAPGETVAVSLTVELAETASGVVAGPPAGTAVLAAPQIVADDARLGRFVTASIADLNGLRLVASGHPDEEFLAAGVPWFLTLFGRDSIWAARMLLPLGTDLALGTLRVLARLQGSSLDIRTGEQPGKILHEVRRERNEHWLWRSEANRPLGLPPVYYGTVDATPLWVCLLHDAWRWGLADEEVERLLDPLEGCLQWLADHGCRQDGFVSYFDESGSGLSNQGWKDSHDAIQFRSGQVATAPLSLCEVQAYAYEAAVGGAELLDSFARPGADRWREFAAGLARRFRARFWVEDELGPYPAVALDGGGRAVDSLSSNIGHLLGTGLLNAEEADLVARRLGGTDLSSGFGLRTLAASSAGFNPLSYHCGSIWSHDTAIALTGLTRTPGEAARASAATLVEGLLAGAEGFEYRMPELYGGHDRRGRSAPLAYPASCRPQAWAAASSVAVLAALLGVEPNVPAGKLRLDPIPSATGLKRIEGLVLRGATFSVVLEGGRATATGGPALASLEISPGGGRAAQQRVR